MGNSAQITQAEFATIQKKIEEALTPTTTGAVVAPPDEEMLASFREALNQEGLTLRATARSLKFLLETSVRAQWNRKTQQWDYFVDGELRRRILDIVIKGHGGYSPTKHVNLNIDTTLDKILKDTDMPQHEAEEKIQQYIDEVTGTERQTFDKKPEK